MNPVAFTGSYLTAAIADANTMATSVAGTITGNAGWLILIASASLIVFIVFYVMRRLRRLGRG